MLIRSEGAPKAGASLRTATRELNSGIVPTFQDYPGLVGRRPEVESTDTPEQVMAIEAGQSARHFPLVEKIGEGVIVQRDLYLVEGLS